MPERQGNSSIGWISAPLPIELVDSTDSTKKVPFKPVIDPDTGSFQMRAGDYTRNGYPGYQRKID